MDEVVISRTRKDSHDKIVTVPTSPPAVSSSSSNTSTSAHPKQPNKLHFNEKINKIKDHIRKAETERGSIANQITVKKDQIRKIREEREKIVRNKSDIFGRLDGANKDVRSKGETVQKLRSGVSYIRMDELDDQIRRLENQLVKSNLKLLDERKLVTEIDRLKRSKKTLQEFDRERSELDKLKKEQQVARERRDQWFKQSKEAKSFEDKVRTDMRMLSEKMEECRHQISSLRNDQRLAEEEFGAQEYLFRKWVGEKRAEQRRRTEMERAAAVREEEKEQEEIKRTCEPLMSERQLCSALISYCENLLGSSNSIVSTPGDPHTPSLDGHNDPPINGASFLALPLSAAAIRRRSSGFSAYSNNSSHYATPLGCSPATTPMSGSPPVSIDEDRPGYYKKKDESSEIFFAGSNSKKVKKRNRNERRLSFRKGLNHNPETFKQFSSLGLDPPSSLAHVEEILFKLKDKLKSFEMQAAEIKLTRLGIHQENNIDKNNTNEIPEIKINAEENIINSDDALNKIDLDRNKLKLDLKIVCIPEIKINNTLEIPEIKVNQTDLVPEIVIDDQTQEVNANDIIKDRDSVDPPAPAATTACDIVEIEAQKNLKLVPSSSPTLTQQSSTSASEASSYLPNNNCNLLPRIITN